MAFGKETSRESYAPRSAPLADVPLDIIVSSASWVVPRRGFFAFNLS